MQLFPLLFVPAVIAATLVLMAMKQSQIGDKSTGSARIRSVAEKIADATTEYVERQLVSVGIVGLVVFAGLAMLFPLSGWYLAVGFLVGMLLSATANYIGLHAAQAGVPRTAAAGKLGELAAFRVALGSGTIVSLTGAALALLGVAGVFWGLQQAAGFTITQASETAIGFGFGAALSAVLLRVSGGIFAKSCDLAEDVLVRTVRGFRENDDKNPVTIADNAGDHAGDNLGAGAGSFATLSIAIIAAMLAANNQMIGDMPTMGPVHLVLPLVLGATMIIAVLVGNNFAHGPHLHAALTRGFFATGVVAACGFGALNTFLTGDYALAGVVGIGVGTGFLAFLITRYYTAGRHMATQKVAEAAAEGPGLAVVSGLGVGLRSALAIGTLLALAVYAAHALAGHYGVALAAVAAASLMSYAHSTGVAAVIADNAAGIGEMIGLPAKERRALDELDELGNTVAATGKSLSLVAVGLTAFGLFAVLEETFFAYGARGDQLILSFTDPAAIVGVLAGVVVPVFFAGVLLMSVVRATRHVVHAATHKHDVIPAALRTARRLAQRPLLLALAIPFGIAYVFGVAALFAMLAALTATGIILALVAANSGSSLDNAKKLVSNGKNDKATVAAANIGDTVGDPLKDTVAPALGVLVEMMILISLIVATVGAEWTGIV